MGFQTTYECGLDVDFMRFVAVQTTNNVSRIESDMPKINLLLPV